MDDIIYFELNNWFSGRDYPDDEPFISWMRNDLRIPFRDETWVKENKLCVVFSFIDMSQNFCITATKEWVEQNCPSLLTNPENEKFLMHPDEYGDVEGKFGPYFLEYEEYNIGITWIDDEDD